MATGSVRLFEQFATEGEGCGTLEAALLKLPVVIVVVVRSSRVGGTRRRAMSTSQSYDGDQQVVYSVVQQRRDFDELAAALRTQPFAVCVHNIKKYR